MHVQSINSLLYGRGRYYTSSEGIQNLQMKTQDKKKQKQAIEALLKLDCQTLKHHVNQNSLTLLDCKALELLMEVIYYFMITILNPIRSTKTCFLSICSKCCFFK